MQELTKLAKSIKTLYDNKFKNNCLIYRYDQQFLFKVKNHLSNGIIDLKYFEFFDCCTDENDNVQLKNETKEELQVFENILKQIFEFYKNEKQIKIKSISLSNNNIGYKSFLILFNLIVNYMSLNPDMFNELRKISLCGNFLNNKCLELLCDLLYSFPEKYESLEELKLGCFEFGQFGENINDDGFLNLVVLIQKRPKMFSKLKLLYLDSLGITIKSIRNLKDHKISLPNLNTLRISEIIDNSFESNQDVCPILLHQLFNNLYECCPCLENILYTPFMYYLFRRELRLKLKVLKKSKVFKKITFTDEIEEKFCPITLEDFKENETILQINNCNHIFSKKAILKWSANNNHCPLCRTLLILD